MEDIRFEVTQYDSLKDFYKEMGLFEILPVPLVASGKLSKAR
jgi:hypothetical protein